MNYIESNAADPATKKAFELWYWGSNKWEPRPTKEGNYLPDMENSWRVWSGGYNAGKNSVQTPQVSV